MAHKKPVGWRGEPGRHALAAKGITTIRRKPVRKGRWAGKWRLMPGEWHSVTIAGKTRWERTVWRYKGADPYHYGKVGKIARLRIHKSQGGYVWSVRSPPDSKSAVGGDSESLRHAQTQAVTAAHKIMQGGM